MVKKLLVDDPGPVGIYRRLAQGTGTFILESAEFDGAWTRWSFVGVRSQAQLVARTGAAEWIGEVPQGLKLSGTTTELLGSALDELHTESIGGLPPLTGGLVGALGWDTVFDWEPNLRRSAPAELDTPDAVMRLVTEMVVVDHHEGTIWLISNAVNSNNRETGGGRSIRSGRGSIG